MKKLNNKGFTLVELIATIVILALVMGIGAISITEVIKKSKEKDYQLFIDEVKNATEEYYIECTFDDKSSIDCPIQNSGYYYIELEDLVTSGFLKGNATIESEDETQNGKITIVNPKDNEPIGNCGIRYKYQNAKLTIEAVNPTGSCPTSY